MKTKPILKTLVLGMLMPTMLLTTACSNDDDAVNTENTIKKGYALPVTVNVIRQGDDATTRATYDGTTGKLSFSAGDQLFVTGSHTTAGQFAGLLTWVSGGTFSGELTTKNKYSGTAEELLTSASLSRATLLPAGYTTYNLLRIENENGYDARLENDFYNAYAPTKKVAVEQLSYEQAEGYSTGFTLTPQVAILYFTISGFNPSEKVNMTFTNSTLYSLSVATPGLPSSIDKTIIADESGVVVFAIGVLDEFRSPCKVAVIGQSSGKTAPSIDFGNSGKFEAGHIYNINRTAIYPLLAAATTADHGKAVCAAGHLHGAKTELPFGCTAVGILGKVTGTGHGLILALKDATAQEGSTINGWASVDTYAGTTLKLLPDDTARGTNLTSYTKLGSTTVSNWAVAQKTDYVAIFTNLGSEKDNDGMTYDANVNAYITTGVGGAALSDLYWSATDGDYLDNAAKVFDNIMWYTRVKSNSYKVRPVLAF